MGFYIEMIRFSKTDILSSKIFNKNGLKFSQVAVCS